jgi:uncharacterized protein YukE
MLDEVSTNHTDLWRLAKSFESHAYDLERHLAAFRGATDPDTLREGFGDSGAARGHAELAEQMAVALGEMHRHLESIGQNLARNANNSKAVDEAVTETFGGL